MNIDKKKYMQKFETDLRVLHKDYRVLESQHNELTSSQKLQNDIETKLRIKEELREHWEKLDLRHKTAIETNAKNKTLLEELTMELNFLQE